MTNQLGDQFKGAGASDQEVQPETTIPSDTRPPFERQAWSNETAADHLVRRGLCQKGVPIPSRTV